MDALQTFRLEVRAWLEENCPASQRTPITQAEQYWGGRKGKDKFASEDAKIWFERMRDKGWTVPEWPVEYGGGGLSAEQAKVLKDEMKKLGCRTPLYGLGIWMLGPALLEYGNEEQKREHLPKIARGEIRWCQGYSEPGAGSDLAGLQCKAEDMGDHFLVNGTKIWTTHADQCDFIFCLVRTNPDVKKQEGISFLLIDMDQPGVSTSPIELISGESEFCQTFFDNVKAPKHFLVGELDKGWSVAKALLKHERKLMSEIGTETPGPSFTPAQAAKQYVGVNEQGKLKDASLRAQLVEHDMYMHALGLTHFRTFAESRAGQGNGHTPLIMKLCGTEEEKRKNELLMAILGSQGLGWEGEAFNADEIKTTRGWLYSKALTIAGGSSEVQLNIIAKRALELPDF